MQSHAFTCSRRCVMSRRVLRQSHGTHRVFPARSSENPFIAMVITYHYCTGSLGYDRASFEGTWSRKNRVRMVIFSRPRHSWAYITVFSDVRLTQTLSLPIRGCARFRLRQPRCLQGEFIVLGKPDHAALHEWRYRKLAMRAQTNKTPGAKPNSRQGIERSGNYLVHSQLVVRTSHPLVCRAVAMHRDATRTPRSSCGIRHSKSSGLTAKDSSTIAGRFNGMPPYREPPVSRDPAAPTLRIDVTKLHDSSATGLAEMSEPRGRRLIHMITDDVETFLDYNKQEGRGCRPSTDQSLYS